MINDLPANQFAPQSGKQGPVGIVLVNWNGWADSIDCLDSLVASLQPGDHIYLVDNDSKDGSLEKIAAWCARPVRPQGACDFPGVLRHSTRCESLPLTVRHVGALGDRAPERTVDCRISLIQSGANRGFAGGNNVGIKLSMAEGSQWFWLLNTDTVVHAAALACLLERAAIKSDAGIVGSTLLYYDEPDTVQAFGGATLDRRTFGSRHLGIGTKADQVPGNPADVESRMDYVVGASMLVSRPFVERIGLMQEDYFLYFEELDWAVRAEGQFRQYWAPRSLVWHKVGSSSAKVMSDFSARLLLTNRLRFVERFYPSRLPAVRRQAWWEWLRHLVKGRSAAAAVSWSVLRDQPIRQSSSNRAPHGRV